ncbi:UvrD-helicase domain-containing protein [Streptomyces sp. NPDC048606]|uniref:UvrD-helicase domain-containing protein n=1 Tax=Streptomyces sp. NPDC048606 TaxID=3154726 RepID=UPI00342D2975
MIVFTRSSLPKYLEISRVGAIPEGIGPGPVQDDDLHVADVSGNRIVIHREDSNSSRLVMMTEEAWSRIHREAGVFALRHLERVDRATRAMARPPVSLPLQWHKFSYENLLGFFALPRNLNPESLRWIAESLPGGHVCFWRLTDRGDPLPLQQFAPDRNQVAGVFDALPEALAGAAAAFGSEAREPRLLQPSVDLERVGAGSLVMDRSYSEWLPLLSESQKRVLDNPLSEPLKIRGVAGSGKTLMLQLKALTELYGGTGPDNGSQGPGESERGDGELPKILFLTHTWAMAHQVEEALQRLDERGLASHIEVMPLTFLREWLQGSLPPTVEILGEDSLDGKLQQLRLVDDAIEEIRAHTWETYSQDTGDWVRQGVEAAGGDDARRRLCWALMREFAEVFDSHEIKPGINALRKYKGLPRENWMVPLTRGGDQEFAFGVYRSYVQRLVEEGQLTTDQLIDDFRRYLETYVWNALRTDKGYDVILIDEFHLFSDSERFLLHLLARDVEAHPHLVMAMDPSQSVFMLLTGLSENEISRGPTALSERPKATSINLDVAHRFTPPVFAFVRFLHSAMPNVVEVGHDWVYEAAPQTGTATGGGVPSAWFGPQEGLPAAAVAAAFDILKKTSNDERVALIGVGNTDLEAIKKALGGAVNGPSSVVTIEGRDDIEKLRYSRRALIVTASEYAAGLQFSHVVVLGGAGGSFEYGSGASAKRALYSQFYLAASRAQEHLTVFAPEDGEFSDIVNRGVEAQVINQR